MNIRYLGLTPHTWSCIEMILRSDSHEVKTVVVKTGEDVILQLTSQDT